MKIIAKVKDYYDHCVGQYGVDPKLVYDRRDGEPFQIEMCKPGYLIHVHINRYVFPMILSDGKFHGNKEAFERLQYERDQADKRDKYHFPKGSSSDLVRHWKHWYYTESDKNVELREPVLVEHKGNTHYHHFGYDSDREAVKPLLLSQYNFASVMSPENAWINISNFLGWCVDNPPLPNNQTNKEKILSHGFDLKRSFRH